MMSIVVKPLGGDPFLVQLPLGASVGSLKQMIQMLQGCPVTHQRLIHSGKQLSNESDVRECGIEPGDAVHLVLRHVVRVPRVRGKTAVVVEVRQLRPVGPRQRRGGVAQACAPISVSLS